jgi:hypothetical protein
MPTQSTQIFLGNTQIPFYYIGDTQVGANPISVPPFNQNGLIAYFNAGNISSYPTSGSVWYDISGRGLQAKPVSGSTFPTFDSSNKTFVFNGTSDVVSATFTTSSLTNQTQITWLKLATNTPTGSGVSNIGSAPDQAAGVEQPTITFDGISYDEANDQKFRAQSANGVRTITAGTATTNTTEYFMVSRTIQSGPSTGSLILYVNNAVSASGTQQPIAYSGSLQVVIGNRFLNDPNWASDGYFSGSISSYLLYNRILSSNEITELYNLGPNLNDI